ncbi:MAG: anaerobic ribonucleoside-triphosphate reductase activating protein [Clostridia bacterium]|nr:anaerobic ribonucleoside-triphosphate reductase activating protein [Clostridia bacterium]
MVFGGLQKLTLLDFPGKVACTVFTKGCNFYCPFCHNAFLVNNSPVPDIHEDEILSFLKKRTGVLDGVCITGGEPLINPGIHNFIKEVKSLGFAVKLDTNGYLPEKLESLVNEGLIDYVAMDVKNCFEKYDVTSGCKNTDISKIKKSISFLLSDKVDYEFRTTVVKPLHTPRDIESLAAQISGAKRYFLQNYVDSGNILSSDSLCSFDGGELKNLLISAQKHIPCACVRGSEIKNF